MNFGGQESTREGEKFRGTLNSIAYGEVMAAAAKNLQRVRAKTRTHESEREGLAGSPVRVGSKHLTTCVTLSPLFFLRLPFAHSFETTVRK